MKALSGLAGLAGVWTLWLVIGAIAAPSGGAIRRECAGHGGVLQVSRTQVLLGNEVVVCRDGWAGIL